MQSALTNTSIVTKHVLFSALD